jgi:AcrR family transcriptional regulator
VVRHAGRRPGATETRDAIISAARRLFAEKGYDGATIRGIAAEAGVNPALVYHFFGTKQQVFVAALDFPIEPAEMIRQIVTGPRREVGQRIIRTFLAVWNDPPARASLLALFRSVTTNEQTAAMFRQFIEAALLGRVTSALGVPKERMTAAMAQMVGLVLLRYVLRVEPLASLGDEEIVHLVAPTIQRYIDGA